MRVYRDSDGYIVTYTPDDVESFNYPGPSPPTLLGLQGFFEFDRSGNLRSMDDLQPASRALATFAVHCRDFAEREFQLDGPSKEDLEYEPHLIEHDLGGEG